MTRIKGNKALAEEIGISLKTLYNWKREGILEPAVVFHYRRTIVYNLEKVFECLKHRPVSRGRKCSR